MTSSTKTNLNKNQGEMNAVGRTLKEQKAFLGVLNSSSQNNTSWLFTWCDRLMCQMTKG